MFAAHSTQKKFRLIYTEIIEKNHLQPHSRRGARSGNLSGNHCSQNFSSATEKEIQEINGREYKNTANTHTETGEGSESA